ncbi:MAG TPA: hypothetical protein VGH28_33590 [Polyangiaceae bacterium]|jgi:hypothetical protein
MITRRQRGASLFVLGSLFLACVGDDSGVPPGNDGGTEAGDGSLPDVVATDGTTTDATGSDADVQPTPTGTVKFAVTAIGDNVIGNAVAFDGLGNVYFGGSYLSATAIDLGNGKSLPANATVYDGFVAKYDATGKCLWGVVLDGTDDGNKQIFSLAAEANGDVVFAADTGGATSVKLDGASVASHGGNDIAIARLNGAGQQVWLRTLASASYEFPDAIAVDTTGRIALAGKYIRNGATDVAFDGITANPPEQPNSAGFVALLDATGVTTALKAFPYTDSGAGSYVEPHAVAFAPDGNIVVGGEFIGTIELRNGESVGQAVPSNGANDAFIAKIDSTTNKIIWAQTFGGASADNIHGVGVDPSGNVIAAFNYGSAFTIGTTGTLPAPAGFVDIGVVRFDPNGGAPTAFAYGSAQTDVPAKLAVDQWGELIVVGLMNASISFGTKVATAAGGGDGFIAKLSPAGTGLWAYGIGGSGNNDQTNAVDVDKAGNVAAIGTLGGSGNPITLLGSTVNVGPGKSAAFFAVTSP